MKDLTKIYIDLSKCSEEQRKHIFSLLPNPKFDYQHDITEEDFKLHISANSWWVLNNYEVKGKTELLYPEFIKLFEGGEGENELEVWLNRQIEKCQELDMPREEWAFIQVLKKINSNQ